MLLLPHSSVPAVYTCFSVEEPVQGFSAPASCMRIHPLVNLSHCVEQAPRRPWQELTVTGFTPFAEHIWNLGCGDRTSIQCPDHNVVRSLVSDQCFVAENPMVKAFEFIPKQPHGSCCQMTQITLGKAFVFPCEFDFSAEAKVVANKDGHPSHYASGEGLIVTVPESEHPSVVVFDFATLDFHQPKVAVAIMTQAVCLGVLPKT